MPPYRPAQERFWEKVDADGVCWEWTAGVNASGYGIFGIGGTSYLAHRWAYETLVGPIPEGFQIDHLCRNRKCVCPEHLEPVTPRTNAQRGHLPFNRLRRITHCKHGHPLSGDNLGRDWRGHRRCLACARRSTADWRAHKKATGRTA